MTTGSVASITVTYKPGPGFREHLKALLAQSRPLDEIVVVENETRKETADLISREFPQIKLLPLQENLGVSAYAVGMEYAIERGHEWVWTLDDDSLPASTSIEVLLEAFETLGEAKDIGLIAPLPINADTGEAYELWRWKSGMVRIAVHQIGLMWIWRFLQAP